MPTCERCWAEAGGDFEHYRELVERNDCTPQQQAGPNAGFCVACWERTRHQHCGICMRCGTEDPDHSA